MQPKILRFALFLLIFLTLPLTAIAQAINIPDPVPPPRRVRDTFELDPFYQQWVDVEGFPVVASEQVNPYALKEAAWQILQMIGHRRDVLEAFVQKRLRFSVIAHNELISEIPEYSFPFPDFLSYWQRGIGGTGIEVPGHPAVSSSEENILHYPKGGGSYNALIHEFAHAIHLFGLDTIDPTFDTRLKAAYDAAMQKGLWHGTYAASDRREYWAEGTHGWFYPKGAGSFDNYGNTRSALKTYDPPLAALLAEVYGDTEWLYTPPAVRLHLPHLQEFNPQDSPTFQGFPELEAVYRQFHDPNSDGRDNWVDLRPYDPSLIPTLNESRTQGRLTGIGFINVTQADVSLYWVRRDGTESYWTRAQPGISRVAPTRTDAIWLIKDQKGKNLAVFQPVEQAGRAIIRSEMGLITPGLSKASGDNQAGISGAALPKPFVVEVRDENLSVLEGISVTFTVVAGDGTLSVTHTTTDANGQAESQFTLGASLGTNAVSVSAAGVGQSVVFNAVAEAAINIPDPNLRAVIEGALSKVTGDPITASEMATLTRLEANEAGINNLVGLEYAKNLTSLDFWRGSVSDLSPIAGLTNLTFLGAASNRKISDISALVGLTSLTDLFLNGNSIADISLIAGLTNLKQLSLSYNSISDISALTGLTKLTWLKLDRNAITDISALAHLTNLRHLVLYVNKISDPSPVAGLTDLTHLNLAENSISDISALVNLTNLTYLELPFNSISNLSPLVANTGLGSGDEVDVRGNPLSYQSIYTHIPTLQSRGVSLEFDPIPISEYHLSLPVGISLIHVPLKVIAVDGVAQRIESISALYDALGGVNAVNYLITYDSSTQTWLSYFSTADRNTAADRGLTDEMGILAGMKAEATIRLRGEPLGTAGSSAIALNQGLTLVGLPLKDSRISRVSDLLALEGIGGNVPVIILTDDGEFKAVGRAGDPGDIPITGGQGFILTAQQAAQVTISGEPWTTGAETALAPSTAQLGIEIGDTTPVLGIKGSVVNEVSGINQAGFRVVVKNLSNPIKVHSAAAAVNGDDRGGYRLTIVDIESARAAQVGDVLEISARSTNPFIGVEPLRYTVAAEDVKRSLIQLTELVAYEIPAETVLLANYPNPFNPETWIPYRLAEDAFVTLTIYDGKGQVVRSLDVGHQVAAVYESRSKAIYWDGRNNLGEMVASGIYFYTLTAGDYSATRRLVILK